MQHTGRRLVVGAAIIDRAHGPARVLAGRRTTPPETAGRWEFPGGKVEAAESPEAALVREVAEELGLTVEVTGWLEGRVPVGERYELAVGLAVVVTGAAEPTEHDRLSWLTATELGHVDWLDPDRPFLAQLRAILAT